MANQIRFYRGISGSSLPSKKDGAVFIIANEYITDDASKINYFGDMYVDMADGDTTRRIQIRPNDALYYIRREDLLEDGALYGQPSVPGRVYVIDNYLIENNNGVIEYTPGFMVGTETVSGQETKSHLNNLPVYVPVTTTSINNWNNKVKVKATPIKINGSDIDYKIEFFK